MPVRATDAGGGPPARNAKPGRNFVSKGKRNSRRSKEQQNRKLPPFRSVGIPAYCASCDTVHLVPNIIGGTGSAIMLRDCRATCPACGRMADVLDGVYELVDDVASLGIAPDSTVAQLRRHQRELYAAVESGSEESQWRAVESLDAALAERLRTWLRDKPATVVSWVLLAVLAGMLGRVGELLIDARLEGPRVENVQPVPPPVTPPQPTVSRSPMEMN